MYRRLLAFASLLFSLFSPAAASEAESEVRRAVAVFGEAFVDGNVEALDSALTADYVHVNGSSGNVLTREDWLHWIGTRRAAIESGQLAIESYELSDLIVRVDGDSAVVVGRAQSRGIDDGKAFDSDVRFTNLWRLRDGVWRRAAFHDSAINESR